MSRDTVGALIFLAFSLAYGAATFDIHLFPGAEQAPFTPQTMPIALAALGIVVSGAMIFQSLRRTAARDTLAATFGGKNWSTVFLLAGLMVLYGLTIREAGFMLSTALFLFGGFWVLGERRWIVMATTAIAVSVGFWTILSPLLGIYLDPGIFRFLSEGG